MSTQLQAEDGESLAVQERQIQGRAMQEGWTLDKNFIERAVSGSKPFDDREQGAALLARLQPGDIVVAAKSTACSGRPWTHSPPATASSATASRSISSTWAAT